MPTLSVSLAFRNFCTGLNRNVAFYVEKLARYFRTNLSTANSVRLFFFPSFQNTRTIFVLILQTQKLSHAHCSCIIAQHDDDERPIIKSSIKIENKSFASVRMRELRRKKNHLTPTIILLFIEYDRCLNAQSTSTFFTLTLNKTTFDLFSSNVLPIKMCDAMFQHEFSMRIFLRIFFLRSFYAVLLLD